jgi:endonuclease YncB( thermonuclease family)
MRAATSRFGRIGAALGPWLVALGCARVAPIDDAGKGAPLAPQEKTAVREQVAKAQGAGEWTAAWNQEIAAGGDRATLEMIAVKALEDDSGAAKDMFRELRAHGPLGEEARAMLRAAVQRAEGKDRWSRAMDLAIGAAEDPPEFAGAWELYRRAPPDEAPALLEQIRKAREAHVAKAAESPR